MWRCSPPWSPAFWRPRPLRPRRRPRTAATGRGWGRPWRGRYSAGHHKRCDEPPAAIVTGGGASPHDSQGNPWNAGYIVASGNLLADMRFNVTAESQGRLQMARLYQPTHDGGVRD